MKKLDILMNKLDDQRSNKVVFVAHCILNVNTRYLGGAFRKGSVTEIVEYLISLDIGIVQMKCPEEWAWGGVLKKLLWIAFDTQRTFISACKPLLLRLFLAYTRIVYHKLAQETMCMIVDYTRSGFNIVGIIGVDGSPTCGVITKLDMNKAFSFLSAQKLGHVERDSFNTALYQSCAAFGRGLFIQSLEKKLKRTKIEIPILSHSLISEMNQHSDFENWRMF